MAPVSRNYQEMRDRLRNLYLLKKAKQNVNSTNDTVNQKQKESNIHRPPAHQTHLLSQSNDKSGEYTFLYCNYIKLIIYIYKSLY